MTGVQELRSWKKIYKETLDLIRKEEKKLDNLKQSNSSYEVEATEGRITLAKEELSILGNKIVNSWIDD